MDRSSNGYIVAVVGVQDDGPTLLVRLRSQMHRSRNGRGREEDGTAREWGSEGSEVVESESPSRSKWREDKAGVRLQGPGTGNSGVSEVRYGGQSTIVRTEGEESRGLTKA
jgi:hypothetical protein